MYQKFSKQRGQAIVLIALAILGMVAITGLAIDGSNSFNSRRHAQTAADNAALAAALAEVNSHDADTGAYGITRRNGYDDPTVEIINGADGEAFTNCQGDAIDPVDHTTTWDKAEYYIEVKIRSSVTTYLGSVVGITQLNYCVDAIARSLPTELTSAAFGNAVAGLQCHGEKVVDTTGSSDITLTGGGIFSNSDGNPALYAKTSGGGGLVGPGLTSVGGIYTNTGLPQSTGAFQLSCPLPEDAMPKYTCGYNYYTDFPPSNTDDNVTIFGSGSDKTAIINPGVYCLHAGFTDAFNLNGNEVTFVLLNQGIQWNGNTKIHLTAPSSGQTAGLLIYLPYDNPSEIRLNGTADAGMGNQSFVGSVFAPASLIYLSGDFAANAMDSQWIGNTVKMTGNLKANIHYDDSKTYDFVYPPILELSR